MSVINPTIGNPWICPNCKFEGKNSQLRKSHYAEHPDHRPNSSPALRRRRRKRTNVMDLVELTTVSDSTVAEVFIRFCTSCGTRKGMDHAYCGHYGRKL